MCRDGQVLLFEVIQGELRDTLRIREQLGSRRGLTNASQKANSHTPSRLLRIFSYSYQFEIHTYLTQTSFKIRVHGLSEDVSGTSDLHNNICAWNTSVLQFQHSESSAIKTLAYSICLN